jgi:hypothetical protein
MRPDRPTEHVPPGFPAVSGSAPGDALGLGEALALGEALGLGLALGLGDGLALELHVVLAWATPPSATVIAAAAAIMAGQRPMPGNRFRFNAGPPR